MSLIKFNKSRFPWASDSHTNWLDSDDFFTNDFFEKKSNLPALNVKETDQAFEVELVITGFLKSDIEVTLVDDVLCVTGENSKEASEQLKKKIAIH